MPRKDGWRSRYKIHPAANLLPMLEKADLKVLGEDIKKNGLQNKVVWFETKTGDRFLLDGRNRLDAMELVDINTDTEGRTVFEKGRTAFEKDVDPYEFVLSLNINRRHLTADQKREIILKILAERPELSDRAIAKMVKVSPSTVATKRQSSNVQSGHNQRVESSGRCARGRKPGSAAPVAVAEVAEPPEPVIQDVAAPESSPINSRVNDALSEQEAEPETIASDATVEPVEEAEQPEPQPEPEPETVEPVEEAKPEHQPGPEPEIEPAQEATVTARAREWNWYTPKMVLVGRFLQELRTVNDRVISSQGDRAAMDAALRDARNTAMTFIEQLGDVGE